MAVDSFIIFLVTQPNIQNQTFESILDLKMGLFKFKLQSLNWFQR